MFGKNRDASCGDGMSRAVQEMIGPLALEPVDFLAIDFETANRHRASACSVGIAGIRDSKIVHVGSTLIDPEAEFEEMNVHIHGIHPEQVVGSPTFPMVWSALHPIVVRTTLVAHNAPFDASVVSQSLQRYGFAVPQYEWQCTLALGYEVWPNAKNYQLQTLCRMNGIPLDHHQAESDAVACAQLLLIGLSKSRR